MWDGGSIILWPGVALMGAGVVRGCQMKHNSGLGDGGVYFSTSNASFISLA